MNDSRMIKDHALMMKTRVMNKLCVKHEWIKCILYKPGINHEWINHNMIHHESNELQINESWMNESNEFLMNKSWRIESWMINDPALWLCINNEEWRYEWVMYESWINHEWWWMIMINDHELVN